MQCKQGFAGGVASPTSDLLINALQACSISIGTTADAAAALAEAAPPGQQPSDGLVRIGDGQASTIDV